MPNFDGRGPMRAGMMPGKRREFCGNAHAMSFSHNHRRRFVPGGEGFGPMGHSDGFGPGRGPGRSPGHRWYAVGYRTDAKTPAQSEGLRASLEARKAFLSAELARTEALISETVANKESENKA